ncbi:hypothetical protein Q2941_04040 [Bradyrhizobium sp. UFLA05-153]
MDAFAVPPLMTVGLGEVWSMVTVSVAFGIPELAKFQLPAMNQSEDVAPVQIGFPASAGCADINAVSAVDARSSESACERFADSGRCDPGMKREKGWAGFRARPVEIICNSVIHSAGTTAACLMSV